MNQKFKDYYGALLPSDEYEKFITQIKSGSTLKRGLRINTLLAENNPKEVLKDVKSYKKLPWNNTGYYYESDLPIGNLQGYKKGTIYSQEPTSQIAVELLDIQNDQIILDLCASPGSKTTHIAANSDNKSFIIANEISTDRYLTLRNNLRHYGVVSAAITALEPRYFAKNYLNTFDRILVDAPCSGEGMYFKFPAVLKHWNLKTIKFNANRQKKILSDACRALKPGGRLVYSTCTLNLEENEKVIQYILKKFFGNIELINIDTKKLGLYNKGKSGRKIKEGMIKLWPQEFNTGGFFACVLTKNIATEEFEQKSSTRLTSRQKKQEAHKDKYNSKKVNMREGWSICTKKEELSIMNILGKLTGGGNLKTPRGFIIAKHNDVFYLQNVKVYRLFSGLPLRQAGIPIIEEVGGIKKASEAALRWLNLS